MSTIDRAFPSAHALSLPAIPATPEHAPAFSLSMLDAVVQQAGAEQIQAPAAAPDQSPVRPKIQFSLPYPLPGAVEPEDPSSPPPHQVIAENGVQAGGSNAVILCPSCGKRYSDAAMLEMHKRFHNERMMRRKTVNKAPATLLHDSPLEDCQPANSGKVPLKNQLRRSESWMPKASVKLVRGGYAINAVWGCDAGDFLVSAGANGIVMIRDYPSMVVLRGFFFNCGVNALAGSTDGTVIACGLRSGVVEIFDISALRDPEQEGPPPETLSHGGSVCALWMSPDKARLVVAWKGHLTFWGRQLNTSTSPSGANRKATGAPRRMNFPAGHEWQKLLEIDRPDYNSRFMGQHCLSGTASSYAWNSDVVTGGLVLAVGGRESVQVISIDTGNTVIEFQNAQVNGSSVTCNAVWLQEGARLLATARATGRINVYGLPSGEIIHSFHGTGRIWALAGNDQYLAAGGFEKTVTIRSLETGCILFVFAQSGTIYSLWGRLDGTYMTCAGRGSLQTRCLTSLPVSFELKCPKVKGWTEAMWSDGRIVAWGGEEGKVLVYAMLSGKSLASFDIRDGEDVNEVISSLWGYELLDDYAIAVGSGNKVVVRSLQTGTILHRIYTPGPVLCMAGNPELGHLAVAGMYGAVNTYDLRTAAYKEALGTTVEPCASWPCGAKVGRMHLFAHLGWIAYSENANLVVRHMGSGDVVHENHCPAPIQSLWGSMDEMVLVTGLGNGRAILYCTASGAELMEIECHSPVRSVYGCGGFDAAGSACMSIATGTSSGKVQIWKVTNTGHHSKAAGKHALTSARSLIHRAQAKNASDHKLRLARIERISDHRSRALHPDDLHCVLMHHLNNPYQEVNCIWLSEAGDMLAISGGDHCVTVFRLDTLESAGPTLKMMRRNEDDLCDTLRRYYAALGPLLLNGSLVEWLISSGLEDALGVLLKLRPSAALFLLPPDDEHPETARRRSAFELAILLRRDKCLGKLLDAASTFARFGEPALIVRHPSLFQDSYTRNMLPPGMRHVTNCIRITLIMQEDVMKEQILRFLSENHTVDLEVSQKMLPRMRVERFWGSPSPSQYKCYTNQKEFALEETLLWETDQEAGRGFPASATVCLLPGLTNYSILQLLADQDADLLYTPPIRTLIDAMKASGIKSTFALQVVLYIVMLVCFIQFEARVVMDIHVDRDNFSWDRIASFHSVWIGFWCGVVACLFALYFLYLEWLDVFEGTFDEEVDDDAEEKDIQKIESKFERLGDAEEGMAPEQGFVKWTSMAFSASMKGLMRRTTAPSPRLLQSRSVGPGGGDSPQATRFRLDSVHLADAMRIQARKRPKVSTLRHYMRYIDIDVDYFLDLWNILGLSSFILLICSCSLFLRASSRCSEAFTGCATLSPKDNMTLVWHYPLEDDCPDLKARCEDELVLLRAITTIAVCLSCFYLQYYVRCVDEWAFCVRMLGQITLDMGPFLVLTCWFLVTMTFAVMCLDCGPHADDVESYNTAGDKISEFFITFASLLLAVFEPSRHVMQACLEHENAITKSLSTFLFYLQLFVLPLIALNALIAIMGSTYDKVESKHKQQQYKEWAGIIADVVRKWTAAQRREFQRKFYWIHVLIRKNEDRTSNAFDNIGEHGEPILVEAAAIQRSHALKTRRKVGPLTAAAHHNHNQAHEGRMGHVFGDNTLDSVVQTRLEHMEFYLMMIAEKVGAHHDDHNGPG